MIILPVVECGLIKKLHRLYEGKLKSPSLAYNRREIPDKRPLGYDMCAAA
jgi:hypothetical protein